MKIVLDIGNTRFKWGAAEAGRLRERHSVVHAGGLPAAVTERWSRMPAPQSVVAVSVSAPALWSQLSAWMEHHWSVSPTRLATPAAGAGIRIAYPEPETLGVDRWAAMAGAAGNGLLPACIVDCGTAVTFDVVDPYGCHRGGLIAPGLTAMRQVLSQRTHGLPLVNEGPIEPLATDTPTAVRSGTQLGLAVMIEGLAREVTASAGIDVPPRYVITGGDAPVLLPHLVSPWEHHPDLVLEGVARIAETEGA